MTMREKLIELLEEAEGLVNNDVPSLEQIADHLIANGVIIKSDCENCASATTRVIDKLHGEIAKHRWIPVTERLPEPETEVLILARGTQYWFKGTLTTHHIVTTGMYEDGSKNTEDSEWRWYDHDFKYDEELDAYIIPEGWWEYKHYNGDDEHNHPIDNTVTHWMPLPEPPKE